MKQSGYFRLVTTAALGMGITDGKFILCHCIPDLRRDNKTSTIEYNSITIYDCFNNIFSIYFSGTDLNLLPMTINDRYRPKKEAYYTSYPLPDTIYVPFVNSVSNYTTPSESPQVFLLSSNDLDTDNIFIRDKPGLVRGEGGHCFRLHD